jgi:hypothetical protein
MMRRVLLLILASLPAILCPGAASAQPSGQATPSREQLPLSIFLRGTPLGSEQVVIERTAGGWKVSSTARLSDPLAFVLRLGELSYDAEWRPRGLSMQGSLRDVGFDVRVALSPAPAGLRAEVVATQGTETSARTDTVSADTVLLPNNFYGSYVALARRLVTMAAGTTFRVYVAPQAEVDATLVSVATERLRTPTRVFEVRRHRLSLKNPGGALTVDVLTEADGRLARISIPSVALDVAREDVAAISTRQERFSREGDEDVSILANGFNLAASVSRPRNVVDPNPRKPTRLPAVILVAGTGQVDRDEVVAGIPIFGQLASALADAGYLVVRYDKRGVGQSGGRAETATIQDYAEDVLAVVQYLRKRKDVDRDRIAVVGHSEGGWVGLLAASRSKRIARVPLAGVPSITGSELVLEQQLHLLKRAGTPDAELEAKVALQKRINSAVMFGTSWEGVALGVRRQADTPWFASFLRFDPSSVMPKVKQPVLVVQGDLDRQVAAYHGGKLAELARARKKNAGADLVTIAGVNHLFVPATTGEVDEYGSLSGQAIDPEWPKAIAAWLASTARR